MSTSGRSQGFTLVEILVISPILIIFISVLLALLVTLTTNNMISNTEVDLAADTKTALNAVEDDMNIASRFLTAKDSGYADPYGPDNSGAAWSYKGGGSKDRVLLARTYSTSASTKDPNKTPVYINQYGCDEAVLPSNPTLLTNTIFFIRNGNLYRRTLTDTSQTLCNNQFQLQSCPPELSSPNPLCKTKDSLLLTDVTAFDVEYYANSSDTTPIDAYTSNDPDVLNLAKTIKVQLETERTVAGETLTYASSIKISRLNN